MKTSTNRTRKWRNSNRDAHNEYTKRYRSSTGKRNENDIWRTNDPRKRAALIRATPKWADHEQIKRIYEKCDALNAQYPSTGFVVHHIVPISHPQVCGLHVPENLKIISARLKSKLGRKFIRD